MQRRVCQFLRRKLEPKGFDVIIPLSAEQYNANLQSSGKDFSAYLLPKLHDALKTHCLVLIGNTKRLWPPFLHHLATVELAQQEPSDPPDGVELPTTIQPHPLDRYTKSTMEQVIDELRHEQELTPPGKVYYTFDMEPGKVMLAQRMAFASEHFTSCKASHMCVHPKYGPWVAFRAAMLFPFEAEEMDESQRAPTSCDHPDEMHQTADEQMQRAFESYESVRKGIVPKGAWKFWAQPRITISPDHEWMYSDGQILYHYSKELEVLRKLVVAHQQGLATDFALDPPSPTVLKCRHLLQQALLDAQKNNPLDGIILSGGLDTSVIAEASAQPMDDGIVALDKQGAGKPIINVPHALTVKACDEARDASFAKAICDRVGMQHHVIDTSLEQLLSHSKDVAKVLKSFDPMELRNSIVIQAALRKAQELGLKCVLTGDGSDELFCGYPFFFNMTQEALNSYRPRMARTMRFTGGVLAEQLGIQVVSPFLDPKVIEFALQLQKPDLIGERTPVSRDAGKLHGKLVVRQAFPEAYSQWRSKEPIEAGSGSIQLRRGYFSTRWTDQEFAQKQRAMYHQHDVVVRDKEHLFFFEQFLEAFDHDLNSVPVQRHGEKNCCPSCHFELSHEEQDFCVTCGFWPAKITATNNFNGNATKTIEELRLLQARLAQ